MRTRNSLIIGTLAWTTFTFAARSTPSAASWTHVLLLFGVFVLFPLALDLLHERRDAGTIAKSMTWARRLHLPAAALLAIACAMPPGGWAFTAAVPWLLFTASLASAGLGRMLRDMWARPLDRLSADVAMGYLVIGGLWLLADRGGVRPLGFDAEIVRLTAVHFHFAGFFLPLASGLLLRQMPESRLASRSIVGVVLGVPTLAVGITFTQLGWTAALEAAAGCGLALNAMAIAVANVRWSLDAEECGRTARVLVAISGIALFFSMILAAAYAVRAYFMPLPWLGLPQMRAVHGTLNVIGFAFCAVAGWALVKREMDAAS